MNGKIGISIYLFHLFKIVDKEIYREYAENLIDDIYGELKNKKLNSDFGNGLAGIGWGINHLIRDGFLDADADEILTELDDKIFQDINSRDQIPLNLWSGLLGYGYYLLSRLEGRDTQNLSNEIYLLERLLIDIVNRIYTEIERDDMWMEEPPSFQITWELPLIAWFLSKVKALGIYDHKIDIICQRISPKLLSIIPLHPGNRFYMLSGLIQLNNQLHELPWGEHIRLLKDNLNPGMILNKFPDKNLIFENGIAGLGFIANNWRNNHINEMCCNLIIDCYSRIQNSTLWDDVARKPKIMGSNLGLFKGLSGIGMAILSYLDFQISTKQLTSNSL